MIITINGLPGVGKSTLCRILASYSNTIRCDEIDLIGTLQRLVDRGLDPKKPYDFVKWQRELLKTAITKLSLISRDNNGIDLIEIGIEQIIGYSISIAKLHDQNIKWNVAYQELKQYAKEASHLKGNLTVVLSADLSVIRERRQVRQVQPDYLGIRMKEESLQGIFLKTLEEYFPSILKIDTTEKNVMDVSSQVWHYILDNFFRPN